MTNIVRMTSRWDGFLGSPGYSNFYVESDGNAPASAQTLSDALYAFWQTVNGLLPSEVDITVLPTWQELNDANGQIIAEGTVGTPAAVTTGNNAGGYAANSGILVEWLTGVFISGHQLKGRTYLVPMIGGFDTDGTIGAAVSATINGAGQDLLDADVINVVWHRPVSGAGGSSEVITSPRVSDTAAVLRSRGK